LWHGTDDGEDHSECGKHAMHQSEWSVWSDQDPSGTEDALREPDRSDGDADGCGVTSVISSPLGRTDVSKCGVHNERDDDRQTDEVGVNDEESCLHDQRGVSSDEVRR
jgi:hypothetical protein